MGRCSRQGSVVKRAFYIPDRGDLVWIDLSPPKGHEQANRRPAVVLSLKSYNKKSGLALMCPLTSQVKGYPFEVHIKEGKITGVILSDQVRSLDWHERKVSFIGKVRPQTLYKIQKNVLILLM
jgi:mRNA interferase MazF